MLGRVGNTAKNVSKYASKKIKLPFTSFNLVASIIFKVMLDELGLEIARDAMIRF